MKKIWKVVSNKFFITAFVFAIWMAFFDSNDWATVRQRSKELQAVKDNITYLNSEIVRMEKEHTGLVSDPQALERFAREHYRMKRDNEDLYVIEHK